MVEWPPNEPMLFPYFFFPVLWLELKWRMWVSLNRSTLCTRGRLSRSKCAAADFFFSNANTATSNFGSNPQTRAANLFLFTELGGDIETWDDNLTRTFRKRLCRNLDRHSVRRHGGYGVHANLDGVALQMTSNRTDADKKTSTGQTVDKACDSLAHR